MILRIFQTLFIAAISFNVSFADDYVYKLLPYKEKIEIDGFAKEAVWSQLEFCENFIQVKGKEKAKFQTRFKAFSDRDYLNILIEFRGQELSSLQAQASEFNKKTQTFPRDQIILYFAPRPEFDDHYCIVIDFHGHIEDCYFPAKAGQGFPYTSKVEWSWNSEARCAIQQNEKVILMEVQIPVEPMNLQRNLFQGFGFNIERRVFYEEDKIKKMEDSCWSYVNSELWNTEYFGLMQGPLYQPAIAFTENDLKNLDQMTNGMTALLKSLDIYYKSVMPYDFHITEGTEISGHIGNFDHVPLPQYPVKADGYYRFYNALQYKPYQELGDHIINKLYKAYSETKDKGGKNLLLWNNLMASDGKVYGYDQGPKISLFANSCPVKFEQSWNHFNLKDVVYQDALGQGFFDLSEIKNSLAPEIQTKIVEMLNGTLGFLHQPHVLVEKDDTYYWRLDSFIPRDTPKPYVGELANSDWQFLGQDVLLMYMALYNFNQEMGTTYTDSMVKFSKFYTLGRLKISTEKGPHAPHNIYQLDQRMLSLSAFAKEKKLDQFEFLTKWIKENLPGQYQEMPKVEYSSNGATRNSWSSQGVLEIYRELGMKSEYRKFWEASFEKNMTPMGLFFCHRIQPMNFSSYPLYFDYSQKAFLAGVLKEEEYMATVKKMFLFYGNPKILRNNLNYARDLTNEQRTRPMWGETPYDCYVEGVLPEGIYANGSPQAFYADFGDRGLGEFFNDRDEHKRYSYNIRYFQYTAPFQYHADRYSYGKAESICLMQMAEPRLAPNQLVTTKDESSVVFKCKTPMTPIGMPAFGCVDVTDLLFERESATNPTQLKVLSIQLSDQKIPFRSYQVLEFNRIQSKQDKAKVVFGLWNPEPGKELEIKIVFKKKTFQSFFSSGDTKK